MMKRIILLTHALWLSIFLLHAWLIMDWVWSFMYWNLIDEITSNCQWSQLLSLVLVLISAGQRVNICSHSCPYLLQGNKLNTFFISNCEWSQLLPLVLVLVFAGQRVDIWNHSCSDLFQVNKLNTFVSLVWINYKVLFLLGSTVARWKLPSQWCFLSNKLKQRQPST
jgi:hypothetical protein